MTDKDKDSKKIIYIPTLKLKPHPDNPRKDLGDLTELAESIKVNGVLQNLTVVPRVGEITGMPTGTYTVVIGNRRLAAAKLAGVDELPCVISDMTKIQQMRTMLSENLQRSDLTAYEQAQGFQMMLDFGDTVGEIAERAGFSESTVRRRVKLLELDKEKFKKAEARGATLTDYAKLEQIECIKVRNEVLDTLGTNNFQNALRRAIEWQMFMQKKKDWLEVIKTFAEEDPQANWDTRDFVCSYDRWTTCPASVPEDADSVKYYYKNDERGIHLWKEKDEEKERALQAKRESLAERLKRVEREFDDISRRHRALRLDFVKKLSNERCKKAACLISGFLLDTVDEMSQGAWMCPHLNMDALAWVLDIKEDLRIGKVLPSSRSALRSAMAAKPEKLMFCVAYCSADTEKDDYWANDWVPVDNYYKYHHRENPRLDRVYKMLEALGYEMSDDEKAMQDGSHELFRRYGK